MTHERVPEQEAHAELAWLFDQRPKYEVSTGFDPDGWTDSIWVLNSMYEFEDTSINLTHDEAERLMRQDSGTESECDHPIKAALDELLSAGAELGMAAHPGPGWNRLWWSEFAERIGVPIPVRKGVPNGRRLVSGSWPVTIEPPCEGSMDEETMRVLPDALPQRHRPDLGAAPGAAGTRLCAPQYLAGGPVLVHLHGLRPVRDEGQRLGPAHSSAGRAPGA